MKKSIITLVLMCLSLAAISCKKETKETTKTTDTVAMTKTIEAAAALSGDYCFEKVENKDSTMVKFRVLSNDDIRGEMLWRPYEKDGATGTLTGKMISKNEIQFDYNYMIEGNRQSEITIMKVDGDRLYIKEGELTEDPNKKGNMILKDAAKAKYKKVLNETDCK
ncbi:hypothetical protein ASG01_03585 [Chryseobacterium sp. Leaf180]|uniref:hypothetical protein n=1 Tax=Chryseobacterium sp. Leaf180 TaxID=1736289 RepID=UPI0006F55A11|nr:hypothetical protein [Chryseobacterium sp. Leaf180]KQR94958.1 hypothetical protein ASG01_03585 [Chryseobacterium sp. Leaf180]